MSLNPAMQSITPQMLTSAFHNRLARVRGSLLDPGMHTALATVVVCLEMLLILLWTETTNDMAFPWFELNFFALLGWINSPWWPSVIVRGLFQKIKGRDTVVTYLMFGVVFYFAYLSVFVLG